MTSINPRTARALSTDGIQEIKGDDLDTLLQENGALGKWEGGESAADEDIQRWMFPRFEGAEDPGDHYLSRAGSGPYDSDVETMVGWLAAPRNIGGGIMVLGDPGTGKTALIEAACTHAERKLITVLCTPEDTKDSLFLRFVGEGKGDKGTPYKLGPLPYAAKIGATLYMDEYMMLSDGTKPITYSFMDGRRFLPEGDVDGSALEIHPDFRIVMSANKDVRGASLPEPVASRCAGSTITVETSASFLRALEVNSDVIAAWEALGQSGLWQPQIRELRVADYWMGTDLDKAMSALIPEHAPESQRVQIRDTVRSFLGGNLRADGRLVVS